MWTEFDALDFMRTASSVAELCDELSDGLMGSRAASKAAIYHKILLDQVIPQPYSSGPVDFNVLQRPMM